MRKHFIRNDSVYIFYEQAPIIATEYRDTNFLLSILTPAVDIKDEKEKTALTNPYVLSLLLRKVVEAIWQRVRPILQWIAVASR